MKILKKLTFILTMVAAICMTGCTAEQSPDDSELESEQSIETEQPELNEEPGGVPTQTKTPTDNVAPTDGSRVIENEFVAVTVGNKWEEVPVEVVSNSITLVKSASESINVLPVPLPPNQTDITVEEYKSIVQDTLSLQPQLKIEKIEVKNRRIGQVIYYEGKIELTSDEVSKLVASGTYSQDIVNEYGGPAAFATAVNMSQVAMYYIDNGKCVAIAGQATHGEDISATKAEIESMINTVVFK